MKWNAFQRDDLAEVQPVQHNDSDRALASAPAGGLPQTHADIPFATASYSSNTERAGSYALGTTLLISKDIEALLKDDEKQRGKDSSYSGSADSSMEYPPYAFEDSGIPVFGLPAPPRGPRKSSPRERRQPSRPRSDGPVGHSPTESRRAEEKIAESIVAQNDDDTLISLSAFGPANALRAPAIGDLALDNSSTLEIEVMNALNSNKSNGTSGPSGIKKRSVLLTMNLQEKGSLLVDLLRIKTMVHQLSPKLLLSTASSLMSKVCTNFFTIDIFPLNLNYMHRRLQSRTR